MAQKKRPPVVVVMGSRFVRERNARTENIPSDVMKHQQSITIKM